MYCSSCGRQAPEEEIVCPYCAYKHGTPIYHTPVPGQNPLPTPAPQQNTAPVPQQGFAPTPQQNTAPTPQQYFAPTQQQNTAPAPQYSFSPAPQQYIAPALVKEKTGLHGFAKGWMIFVIVAYSAVIASNAQYFTNSYYMGILLPPLLCVAVTIVGAALVMRRKPYGLWIMTIFSIVLFMFNGSRYGNVMLVTGMGLPLLILTWVFTRKQIHYFGKKPEGR